jgi:hypothetical protein
MSALSFARIALLSLSVGALPVDKMVRREEVQMAATGEILKVDSKSNQKAKKRVKDYCNWDFPLGEELSDVCPPGSEKLREKEDCEEAAVQAGLQHTVVAEMNEEYKWLKPKGCFMELCPEAGAAGQSPSGTNMGPCYRWNGVEPAPNNVTAGRPVCRRERVKYGSMNGTTEVCPDNYQVVENEDLCLIDGQCLGDSDAQLSLVNKRDANLYDKYPLYCFLDGPNPNDVATTTAAATTTTQGALMQQDPPKRPKVFFNEPLPGIDPVKDKPKNPVGTPICNVTQITWFDKEGTYTPLRGCVRDEHNQCVSLPFLVRDSH